MKQETSMADIDAALEALVASIQSKEQYLAWVAKWKQEVKSLEDEIRKEKFYARGGDAVRDTTEYGVYMFDRKSKGTNDTDSIWNAWHFTHWSKAIGLKPSARKMYRMRRLMKMAAAIVTNR
jgi:hypothetical protein